ncbi:DsbA family protein [Hippea sp. KM1]|uniref:DsbA family protein n=1 Tax=Hippea sp. KM1 TaxID=944481 RepID=UPI00046D50B0|nr:thioredoxin fold domain-containing protein [Hippea sp. KM1]
MKALKGLAIVSSFVLIGSMSASAKTKYDDVLKKIIPSRINYTATVEKDSILKGFDQINVGIENKKTGTIYHRYIWISKDKTTIVPVILKLKDGQLKRATPQKVMERIETDISWFYNLKKELPKSILKSIGNGKTEVYLFSDPLCPFCKRELSKLIKLAEENKIKLYVLPFNVHGEEAKKASAIFLNIVEKDGLKAAIDKIEGAEFNQVKDMVKKEKDIDKLLKKYGSVMDKIAKAAFKNGIEGTPGIVIPKTKQKGYVIVGLSNIEEYIK